MKRIVYDNNLNAVSVDGSKTEKGGSLRNAFEKQNYRDIKAILKITYTQLLQFDPSMNIEVTNEARINFPGQTANGNVLTTHKWASCEGVTKPDSTFYPCPGNVYESYKGDMGWWGEELSAGDNSFTGEQKLTITYTVRPIQFLTVSFDTKRDEYAEDYTVNFYYEENLIHTYSETGNIENLKTIDFTAEELNRVDKTELIITKWSHSRRQVKVTEFSSIFTEIYHGDKIFDISILQETEHEGNSIPFGNISANQIMFKLDNSDRRFSWGNTDSILHGMLRPFNKVECWFGAVTATGSEEYVKMGVYFVEEWTVPDNELYAEATANDRISIIDQSEYTTGEVLTSVSLKDIIEDILLNAGVHSTGFNVGPGLDDIVIENAYIKKKKSRIALRDAVVAGMGKCFCNDDGTITITGHNSFVGVTYSFPEEARYSRYRQMNNRRQSMTHKWISCDGWNKLDGTFYPVPDDIYEAELFEIGYWSQEMCYSGGNFDEDPVIEINLRPVRNIDYLIIRFDESRDEYAEDFTVEFIDKDENVLQTITETGNEYPVYERDDLDDTILTNITTIRLTITTWSLGDSQIKISEFNFLPEDITRPLLGERDYFTFSNPVNLKEIANFIKITTFPLREQNKIGHSEQYVYEDTEEKTVPGMTTRTIEIKFNTTPVVECSSELNSISGSGYIESEKFYSWGAKIKITAISIEDFVYELKIKGKPMIISGQETLIIDSPDSIGKFGKKEYVFPDNKLIQSASIAMLIGNKLLESYRDLRAKTEINFYGNPIFEIGDIMRVKDKYNIKENFMMRQEYKYDGGLESKTTFLEV